MGVGDRFFLVFGSLVSIPVRMAGSAIKRRQIEEKGASLGPRSESLGPRSESFFFYLAASEIRCNSPEYYPNGYFYQFYHSNGYIYRSNGFITGASLLDLGAIFFFCLAASELRCDSPGYEPNSYFDCFYHSNGYFYYSNGYFYHSNGYLFFITTLTSVMLADNHFVWRSLPAVADGS